MEERKKMTRERTSERENVKLITCPTGLWCGVLFSLFLTLVCFGLWGLMAFLPLFVCECVWVFVSVCVCVCECVCVCVFACFPQHCEGEKNRVRHVRWIL